MKSLLVRRETFIEGRKVSYLESRRESDMEPIVFLHGWGISASAFQDTLIALAHKYKVIAPDLPGFGDSSSLKLKLSHVNYADFVKTFIKSLNLTKVHLIGQSMGGGICIALAAMHPSCVLSVILLDTTGIPLGSLQKVVFQRSIEVPLQLLATGFSLRNFHLLRSFAHNSIMNPWCMIDALRLPLKEDLRHLLCKIQAPVLIVWGSRDRTISAKSGIEIAKQVNNSEIVTVKGGYHEWSVLLSEELVGIVDNFIRKLL